MFNRRTADVGERRMGVAIARVVDAHIRVQRLADVVSSDLDELSISHAGADVGDDDSVLFAIEHAQRRLSAA